MTWNKNVPIITFFYNTKQSSRYIIIYSKDINGLS